VPRYPRSPFKKVGASIIPKVSGDALDETILGSTTPAAGDFTTGNFTDILTQNGANLAGSAYQSQSFTNLLENGDFESWSAGASAAPDGWILNVASIDRESGIKKIGLYSAKVTNAGVNSRLEQLYPYYNDYAGQVLTYGCFVHSSVLNAARISISDGIAATNSSYHSGGGDWEWLTATHIMNASPIALKARMFPDIANNNNFAYFDGAILVEGSVCPAFSPKPAPSMSLITSAPTDTGYDGEIRIYSTGGTRRLYISDGTDWKYVSVAT
jgi:hypothetical protein